MRVAYGRARTHIVPASTLGSDVDEDRESIKAEVDHAREIVAGNLDGADKQ